MYYIDATYSVELEIKDTADAPKLNNYIDLHLEFDEDDWLVLGVVHKYQLYMGIDIFVHMGGDGGGGGGGVGCVAMYIPWFVCRNIQLQLGGHDTWYSFLSQNCIYIQLNMALFKSFLLH